MNFDKQVKNELTQSPNKCPTRTILSQVSAALSRPEVGGCRRLGRYLAAALCLGVCLFSNPGTRLANADDARLDEISRPIQSKRNLVIREVGGVTIKADMFRPDDDTLYPLVLMVHGGAWTAGDKWELRDHAREMAQAGFVAVSINYRLAPRVKIQEQVEDCRFALSWAFKNAEQWKADDSRIGLWGYSAGAHLVSLLALMTPDDLVKSEVRESTAPRIAAVVAGGAPCEFSFISSKSPFLVPVMGGTKGDKPDVYLQMSPVEHARPDAPPFFLFHGKADILVPPSSSRALFKALSDLGVDTEYYDVPGVGHLFAFLNRKARRLGIEFLNKHLKNES